MTLQRRQGGAVRTLALCVACGALALVQCTTSLTGGNSSETTNVAVIGDDGNPAISAVVRLVDADNWASRVANNEDPVIDSATTGSWGIVSFARLPRGTCNLQIDHAGSGIVIRNFSGKGKITGGTDTVRLQKYATLLGTCASDTTSPASVMLEGTAYASAVAATGAFSFGAIAPGAYPLVFRSSSNQLALTGSAVLAPDQTVARYELSPGFSSLLVDDFESGYTTSVLGQFTGAAWYNYSDEKDGGSSTVERTLTTNAPQGVFALAADIILRSTPASTWAGIGIPIGEKKPDWDLSAMTAISFWARGRNTIRVSIESPLVDSINNNWPDFGKAIFLDSTWRRYRIPVDSLTLPASKAQALGVTWAMAAKRIYRIEFEGVITSSVADTISLQIDDIRLEGITASDLFLQMAAKE